MPNVDAKKETQRRVGIAARKALDEESAQRFSRIIAEKLIADSAFQRAKIVLSYQPFAGEVDTSFIHLHAEGAGKTLAFPICHENGIMVAAIPDAEHVWETGKYGIKSPIESRSQIIDPAEIDFVVVPCTAFDGRTRMRIGWGAGCYDRYLPQCKKAVSIAVAYEGQQVPGLCLDAWDVPLDAVITEAHRY
ncbi:MAG: 5-formyltetrahydrofolate cyclo-ligase [Clostridiales Family XIII bacterium]|jgi:5-formyltetrahydrofolate cyclo-ligase|nr:5-formyltetrahydrofolate cyclo-ligase [Clostridiales Family XIII bacterium]